MKTATNYTGTILKRFSFLNDTSKPLFEIYKDGELYTEAYFLGWNGEHYMWECNTGSKIYLPGKLTDYSFAQAIRLS